MHAVSIKQKCPQNNWVLNAKYPTIVSQASHKKHIFNIHWPSLKLKSCSQVCIRRKKLHAAKVVALAAVSSSPCQRYCGPTCHGRMGSYLLDPSHYVYSSVCGANTYSFSFELSVFDNMWSIIKTTFITINVMQTEFIETPRKSVLEEEEERKKEEEKEEDKEVEGGDEKLKIKEVKMLGRSNYCIACMF